MNMQILPRALRLYGRIVTLCVALLVTTQIAFAQSKPVSGKVLFTTDKTAAIGATVMVKGTNNGTVTDVNGAFNMEVADGTVLEVSYLGYRPAEVTVIGSKSDYTVLLEEDRQQIDEVVVVGYGTMRKKEVTGAVERVDKESLTKIGTSDVSSALQGMVAGVNVQASSGQPGEQANIQIRGISSVTGNNNPLYVVDGVPFSEDPGLSPQEIESIDVLKDAASAAIYGTRGAGGVILITTKRGEEGKMKVAADLNYGIQNITSGLSLVNASEYTYLQTLKSQGDNEAPNRVWTTLWNSANLFSNDSSLMGLVEQDNQPVMNASVNVSGGSKNLVYSVVGSYYRQDGVIINSGYERFNVRANATLKRNRWTVSANVSGLFDNQETPAWGLYNEIYRNKPINNQTDVDAPTSSGSSDETENTTMTNILAKFKETNENVGRGLNVNTSIAFKIMEGLNISTRFGTGYTSNVLERINPLFELYDSEGELIVNPNARSGIRKEYRNSTNMLSETMLDYHFSKNKHDLKATAVFSVEKYTYESFYANKYDLISNDTPSLGAATGDASVGVGVGQWGQDRTTGLMGMLGRLQYNYDNRFMVSASIRRDASSRFTKENRWGYFPSLSAGWNVSEEKFWSGKIEKVVNNLKIRTSYGTTGNQNFGDYAYAASINSQYDYAFGGSSGDEISYGSSQAEYANEDVKWETTKQLNAGIDISFLKSRLTMTADVYKSDKEDMLLPLMIPPVAGTGENSTVILNVGNMENKGFELALRWRDWKKGFNYWANFTVSRNVNTITKMAGSNKRSPIGTIATPDNDADNITYLCEGMEAGVFLMMPTDGILNTDAELAEYQKKYRSDATMGDLKYVDTNGDGKLDDNDRIDCGSGAPEVELGFNAGVSYKGFDLSMNMYASLGNEVVNGSKIVTYQQSINRDLLYSWSMDNLTSTIPVFNGDKTHYNTRAYADKWVENGSYLRLRNVTFGYSLPQKWMGKSGITKLRLYVAADNILTFTKYDGYDPEVGNNGLSTRGLDNGNYPIAAQIRGGVQLEF